VADGTNRAVVRLVFRLRVRGLENLPDNPCLICPNHASFLDPFVVAAALPYDRLRRTWWTGWTGILFAGPVRRGFSRLAQVLPVDPDRGAASALELGAAVLRRGDDLVWFPEGVRSPDGRLQSFQPGVGALVQRSSALLVPAYIKGTFAAWPRHRRLPRPGQVTMIFGPPRTPEDLLGSGSGASDAERIANGLREAVASLAGDPQR
jgi:long-chain acyl-CoA synthetase